MLAVGLGHLGIQFANKLGYKVAGIGRGSENLALAKRLGASVYIDSQSVDVGRALQEPIEGWVAGTPPDCEDALRCAELTGVRPMIETYPLERASEAYARMMSGHAQFRVVLTM